MLEVRMSSPEGLRATIIANPDERDTYPLGCEASLGFSMQQSLPLESGEGGRAPESRASKRGNGAQTVAAH